MKKLTLDQMRRALADKGVKGYADGNAVAAAKKAPQQVFDTVTQTFITPNENIAGIRLDDQGRTAQDKQKENLYRQLEAIDAWNTAGATREGAEAPWLMDQANRMMAVGVKDDFTGSGPGVLLYDPAKGQSEIVSSGNLSSWFERGDPAAAYEQAKNSLPYFQQKALLGIEGPTTQAQERRIVKTIINNPLPALPFIEYGLGQFAPPNYGLDVNVSRRRAENKLLNRKEKPFEYFQDFLNLTPYQGSMPTIYQFPELTNAKPYAGGGAVDDFTKAKGGSISEQVNHVSQKGVPSIGINVATDKDMRYADLIVDGKKRYESRNSDSLRPWVGKRVSIVRTGEGKAKAIGAATLGEPLVVDASKFRAMQEQHLVPPGSKFDIKAGVKYLYPVNDPERFDKEHDVGHGIVARRVTQTMAEGGAPKKTVTAYKMFRVDPKHPGKLFPLIDCLNGKAKTWI